MPSEKPQSYCRKCAALPPDSTDLNKHYHDRVYGFPVEDDNALFERLVLEINQAGLNWTLILNKQKAFQTAFCGFDIAKVAAFDENDIARLLTDKNIVRNRLKINAAIYNARKILEIRAQYGSFKNWLDSHAPQNKEAWVKLFKKTFKFTGGEITGEFLMSTGYLDGAHDEDCPTYAEILRLKRWVKA